MVENDAVQGELVTQQVEPVRAVLEDREAYALRRHIDAGYPEIAKSTSDKLYELFRVGKSCEEIRRINHPAFSLGQIVQARVKDGWDQRLADEDRRQLEQVPMTVKRVELETAEFLALQLAAANKLNKSKLLRFLQTGDEADLGDLRVTNWTVYQKCLEMLANITGQNNPKQPAPDPQPGPSPSVVVNVNTTGPAPEVKSKLSELAQAKKALKAAETDG